MNTTRTSQPSQDPSPKREGAGPAPQELAQPTIPMAAGLDAPEGDSPLESSPAAPGAVAAVAALAVEAPLVTVQFARRLRLGDQIVIDGRAHTIADIEKKINSSGDMRVRFQDGFMAEYNPWEGVPNVRRAPFVISENPPLKTMQEWHGSKKDLGEYLQVGDLVDQELLDYCINVVPPRTLRSFLVQVGEPSTHLHGRATYTTFAKTGKGWAYTGDCHAGEIVQPPEI